MIPPHPLTNFEIQKYYQNEHRLNGVNSRDNLSETKDGAYVINLDEYADIGIFFDIFGVEHIPKKIKRFIGRSLSITTNIFRMQAYDSIMCGYFCMVSLILCLQEKHYLSLQIFFDQKTLRKMTI